MKCTPQHEAFLHSKLPIDDDEKVLAIYKHHWFAYASTLIVGAVVAVAIIALGVVFSMAGGDTGSLSGHQAPIIAAAVILAAIILLGAAVPAYLRSQEELILTDEALLQMLQPSLFASKVDQLNLQRIDDISVHQDFFGSIFGYGHITIETPGEQDNYEFFMLPSPHDAAREITAARENYEAAMQGGRLPTTMGASQTAPPQIDPQQYQQFLQYQQMLAQQQAQQGGTMPPQADQQAAQANDPTQPQPPAQNDQR